ncbi:MAG TPA: hypothetical protein VMZ28_25130 [Kofleriaceae bacterium]|nr:hypothetical protein [Kofleriaceae bacterium]
MGQPPPPTQPPRTLLLEPAHFRSDPFQRTVMLDVAVAAYHGRAVGTTPPPDTHPRRARRVLFAMVAAVTVALGLWSTYLTLVETEGGRAFLESLYDVIASPLV